MTKKFFYLTFFSLLLTLALVGYASAQTCSQQGGSCTSSAMCDGTIRNAIDCGSGDVCCVSNSGSVPSVDTSGGSQSPVDWSNGSWSSPGGTSVSSTSGGGGWNPGNYSIFNLPEGRIYYIIYNFLFWILALFGAFGLIGFVISGIMYLTSAGDDTQIEKAKKAMKWSLVGVIVGLAGLVVILAVDELLSGWSTRF